MSLDEKISLVHTLYGVPRAERPAPAGSLQSAGYAPGIARLAIPPLEESDAGLGVANPTNAPYDATALPANLAIGATFDPELARRAGAVVGTEARAMGFSVLLGGGANLIREPRGGRNFEYVSEDPLLTGVIAGAEIAGAQSARIVCTMKHFALNAQENGRVVLDAHLTEGAMRESDLLAFEIALERGRPGAVMTSYNRVDGAYASENSLLLSEILKRDWGFEGWVMSDWGGTHSSAAAANAGLDQESGQDDDTAVFFDAPLKADVRAGRVSPARLDDMVARLLAGQIRSGAFDDPPRRGTRIDFVGHADTAEAVARQGIVLLKNAGDALPLPPQTRRVLVVGGHADIGVLSGGGSSQVVPKGGVRFEGIPPRLFYGKPRLYDPSSPLLALRRRAPATRFDFSDGHDIAATRAAAHAADAVVVFAEAWANESLDLPDLALPEDQDARIAALAGANPRTIVVLETTGAVAMPWLGDVAGVVEAWYPGARGGEAIADVLLGRVSPSGRLPVSFPAQVEQLPRPRLPVHETTASYPSEAAHKPSFPVDYDIEGADVGYKWYLRTAQRPLFPFGYGLTYTHFAHDHLHAEVRDGRVHVAFEVRNVGSRAGIDTPQIYLEGGAFGRRLVGWQRIALQPGERRSVALDVDPRLAASFDDKADAWRIAPGTYALSLRDDALADGPALAVALAGRTWSARHTPVASAAALTPSAARLP